MTADQFRAKIREITNTNTGDYSDASLIRDLNSELSMIQIAILRDRGVLEFDDNNYTNLPSATFAVTAGTRSYKITEDEDNNLIFAIHKLSFGGRDIPRVQIGEGNQAALDDQSEAIVPLGYYEMGANIVFTETPQQSGTATIWFDRDVSFLTTSDTTKVPGVPTQYHNLAAYRTSLNYALDKNLPNLDQIQRRVLVEEERLEQFEEARRADEPVTMTVRTFRGL
jgi:hypothetical protein